jgi:hypothetical protein
MRDPYQPIFDQVEHPRFLQPSWQPVDRAYYCRHCIDASPKGGGWGGKEGIRNHLRTIHEYDPYDFLSEGREFFLGTQLRRLLAEWFADNELELMSAQKHLAAIVTVDDFLIDCG